MTNKQSITIKLLLLLLAFNAHSLVNMAHYEGHWQGQFAAADGFNLVVSITPKNNRQYEFIFSNNQYKSTHLITNTTKEFIDLKISDGLRFKGILSKNKDQLHGFIQSGFLFYHLQLKLDKNNSYTGQWPLFMVDRELNNATLFLSIEDAELESYAAYPFFGDKRFTGTWSSRFSKKDNLINFYDMKTGLEFRGTLLKDQILIHTLMAGQVINKSKLIKSTTDWELQSTAITSDQSKPENKNPTDWPTVTAEQSKVYNTLLNQMSESIKADKTSITNSVLVAIDGQLAFEQYFNGFNADISHDQRSASKSISSAMTGIAIDQKIFTNENQKIYDFIPNLYQNTKDSKKSKIKIKDLLTMSSGLDAIDFGNDKPSAAAEDLYQPTPDWLKTVLNAGMIEVPGTKAYYGSANPYLLGVMLQEALNQPLELFIDKHLMQPLGINNYIIQTDTVKQPYFGGGMYLRPRDMLKFGQLYLNKGQWNGQQIISEAWINQSFEKHTVLENTTEKDAYGYLWWHKTYDVKGLKIKSIEARGAGGQVIFVLPELNAVAAITSSNYRNGKYKNPEILMEKYILPAIIKSAE